MKRMFRWKQHLIVAVSKDDAVHLLRQEVLDPLAPGHPRAEGGTPTMAEYERQTRDVSGVDGDWYLHEAYDAVDADEYMSAVPPGELIEIPDGWIPSSLSAGPELTLPETDEESPMLQEPAWTATLEAWAWATILPHGWMWNTDDD